MSAAVVESAHDYKEKSKQKLIEPSVNFLDTTCQKFLMPICALGQELYDLVIEELQLVEYDYFDLEYVNKDGIALWLDHLKPLHRQHTAHKEYVYSFAVKFYTPHPNLLEDEFTRYLFALQIRKDLQSGQLPCHDSTAALLYAFIVQSQIGDFQEELYTDHTYLSSIPGLATSDVGFLNRVVECHRNLVGQTPAEADFNLLDTARKIELYGIRMHPAKDPAGIRLSLSVSHAGILVYQGNTRINTFSWALVRKISFKRKRFQVKLHPDAFNFMEFIFDSRDECKNFWKRCIEHHAFFRCPAVRHTTDRRGRMMLGKGSSFRYTGRTQKQLIDYVRENYVKLSQFERPSTHPSGSTPPAWDISRIANIHSSNPLLNSGVHSDFGPSTGLKARPSTDPAQRSPLTDNPLSPYGTHSFAIAIPIVPSSGGQTIQAFPNMRHPAGNTVLLRGQASLPRTAYLLSNWVNPSSASYATMNSSTSAGSAEISQTPDRSPIKQSQFVSLMTSEHQGRLVFPNQMKLGDISLKQFPLKTGLDQASLNFTLDRAGLVRPMVSGATVVCGSLQPATASQKSLPAPDDRKGSMHTSFVVTTTPDASVNTSNIQSLGPVSSAYINTGYPPLFVDPTKIPCSTQLRFPGTYALVAAPAGVNRIPASQIVYVDPKTGTPFLLTTRAQLPLAGMADRFHLPGAGIQIGNSTEQSSVQRPIDSHAGISSSTTDTHPNARTFYVPTPTVATLRPIRSGPPPPTPQRRDSMFKNPSSTPSQRSSGGAESSQSGEVHLTTNLMPDEGSDSSDISPKPPHPTAFGLIMKHDMSSCLSLAAKGRIALSTRSLCITTADEPDPQRDEHTKHDDRHHSDAETRLDDLSDSADRHSICSQGIMQRPRSLSTKRIPRNYWTMQHSPGCRLGNKNEKEFRVKSEINNAGKSAHVMLHDHVDVALQLIRDMLMTERTYGHDLAIICVHFRRECFSSGDGDKETPLSRELSDRLFKLLDPIYSAHQHCLVSIEERLNAFDVSVGCLSAQGNTPVCRLGDLISSNTSLFTAFEQYLDQTEQLILAIELELRTRSATEKAIRQFEAQKLCHLPFYVYLLKPMRRLLYYRNTLERLMRHYTETNVDASDCRMAHAKLLDLIQSHWESYRRVENTYKLLEIQRDLMGVSAKPSQLGPLYQPGRQFIREGWLQKLSKKGYQPRMFFLFSDQLIYASRTSTSYLQFKVHGQFSLYDLMVEEAEPAHSFTIFSGNLCFLVAAPSDWQRDRWLEDISRAILAAKTKTSAKAEDNILCESLTNGSCDDSRSGIDGINNSLQALHRATTSTHVCWHRNFTNSMQDILRANEYETSGYLLRKFKNSHGWQRLWVVFTQNCLFFYKTFRDDNPLASLPLAGYTIGSPNTEDPIRSEKGVIKLQFKNHVYYFRGETHYSFERWFENLTTASGNNRRA